ncbi:MAG: uvrA, partial [Solirubrobacterales bacterium]|nr:uvrA [Solirubrobacterales bacterium]
CRGDGQIKIEMHFLPDVYVPCEQCHGKRYNRETLEVRFKGKSIADVLEMSVAEAVEFFADIPKIARRLRTLHDVGLDYIRLGQPATQLSGGEAQRVKLATELSKVATGDTLYILDEPTTGLHFADVQRLLDVLDRLVDAGNTVVVIEHNLDVIKTADHIIDLGPEGGEEGGRLIATGTPEQIAAVPESYTGQFLAELVQPEVKVRRASRRRRTPVAA